MLAVHQRRETVDSRLRDDDHTATVTAVAAIRPTTRDVFLPSETDATVAPFAGFDFDRNAVDEHGREESGVGGSDQQKRDAAEGIPGT
jgi:hypothetical protein